MSSIRPTRDQRGIALPAALFALVVIGALVGGVFFTARLELKGGQNSMAAARATEAAQAGLMIGVPNVLTIGNTLTDGQNISSSKTQIGSSGSYYQYNVTRLNHFVYLMRSFGSYEVGGNVISSRTMAMIVKRYMPELAINSGAIVVGNATVSGSADLNGQDQAPPGWTGCPPGVDQPGLRTNGDATLSGHGSVEGTGSPAYQTHDTTVTGMSRVMDTLFFQLASQANILLSSTSGITGAPSDTTISGTTRCNVWRNDNWGDPNRAGGTPGKCESYFPIIYVNNGVNTTQFTMHGDGQGVLLINGDLRFNSNNHYAGLILVRGSFLGGTGTTQLDGSLISLNADLTDDNINGNIDIDYSSCAVTTALNNMSVTAPASYRAFIQF